MLKGRATFDRIKDDLLATLPEFTKDEQRLGLAIYHELAKGHPVSRERLAEVLGRPTREVAASLERRSLASLVFTDDRQRILGFGGLAVAGDLPHRFQVAGQDLFTWCAWDSLFIPPILGQTAQVESAAPDTGERIRLTVAPDGVRVVTPDSTVLSFILPTAAAFDGDAHAAMKSFCHYVHFFPHQTAADAWTAAHPGTFVLSVEEGFRLGEAMNRVRWSAFRADGHPSAA